VQVNKRRVYVFKQVTVVVALVFLALSVVSSRTIVVSKNTQSKNCTYVPVLNYHKVDYQSIALSIAPKEFEEQMEFLYNNGYHTISPDQLVANLQQGEPLPDKPILITFDDGYLDNYINAYPIMKKYGFTATIFIVTSLVGRDERFMTWDQVSEMQQNGFVFGSHTVNHLPLTKLNADQVRYELNESRREIARRIGYEPRYFAYPTGAYNFQIAELVRESGYRAAFTIRYGQVGSDSNLYALERIPIFKGQRTFQSFFIRLRFAPILERMGIIRN